MRKVVLLALALSAVCAVALGPAGAGPGVAPQARVRLAFSSVADVADIPALLAGERLRAGGFVLEPVFFAQEALAVQAVIRGDADIGTGSSRNTLVSMQRGANLKFFLTQHLNLWTLYTRREIARCEDLGGRRLALHSHGGTSTALVQAWLRARCPSVAPVILIVPGSENRAAGLLAGQIDATPLELSDAIQVDRVRPGQFHRLVDFSRDIPWLLNTIFYTSPQTLAARRDMLKQFAAQVLTIHRQAARDPSLIATVAPKYTRVLDVSLLPAIVGAFVEAGLWPTDGAFSPPHMARTLQFFVEIDSIRPGLTPDQVGDYTLVRDVLEQIGRSP